jgi:hypothetical protein
MATNPIGKGTVNVPVNMLEQERRILGQLAMADDRSLGEFIRRLVVTGLRTTNPGAAVEMELARKRHYRQLLLKL